MSDDINKFLNEKLDERIAVVEDPNYKSVPEISKGSVIGGFCLAAVLLVVMIVTYVSV